MMNKMNDDNIMISVCMPTYNHEKYIKQAVDSVLCQKTNFRFELIVGDDASLDRTAQILYDNYSDNMCVKLVLRKNNLRLKNAYLLRKRAKGKYIMMYDGDDYLHGDNVLQYLFDCLESHPDYAGVAARRIAESERTGSRRNIIGKDACDCKITIDDFMQGRNFDLCATLYRNFYSDNRYEYRNYLMSSFAGDLATISYIMLHGPVYQTDKIIGVYRTDRVKGAYSYNSIRSAKQISFEYIEFSKKLEKVLPRISYDEWKYKYAYAYLSTVMTPYCLVKELPYIVEKIGIKLTLRCVKSWIGSYREQVDR